MPQPIILSTWKLGAKASAAGWPHLSGDSASSLDAVEQACRAVEADLEVMTVGRGGYPDRSGEVSVDASIMVSPARCGSVCYVRRFVHPVSIARKVMERSPHVLLAGAGAERFAQQHGFEPGELTTDRSRAEWQRWIAEHPEARQNHRDGYLAGPNLEDRRPESVVGQHAPADPENLPHNRVHDTVGVLACDAHGQLAGACSTSGLPWKLPGRVGDSPIIGHGLYLDPRHGATVATGTGELLMGVCGSFLAVESLRRGAAPLEAATGVMQRILDTFELADQHQAAMIVLAPDGSWASACLRPGFRTAVHTAAGPELREADRVMLP